MILETKQVRLRAHTQSLDRRSRNAYDHFRIGFTNSIIRSLGEVIETIILPVVRFWYHVLYPKIPLLFWFFLVSIKSRLSITISKQDLQIYLKWKTDPII